MIKIDVVKEFTEAPGGRYKTNGDFSGEEFREKILLPKLIQAEKENTKLVVDLDGGYGYALCFLDEAFGGLVKYHEKIDILDNIIIISKDDEFLINYIKKCVSREIHKYLKTITISKAIKKIGLKRFIKYKIYGRYNK